MLELCENCGKEKLKYPDGYYCLTCDISKILRKAKEYIDNLDNKGVKRDETRG